MENTKIFKIPCNDLNVDTASVLTFLGYKQTSSPEPVVKVIDEVLNIIPEIVDAQGGFLILEDHTPEISKSSFLVAGVEFQSGDIITHQLQHSSALAILIATAGEEISDLSSEYLIEKEYLRGYIIDAIGSIITEYTADKIVNELCLVVEKMRLKHTNRLSPGYCGWDVSEQHKLFSLLPDNFCGVTLTESALMVPIKSISAVIGIGENVTKTDYPCTTCDRDDCYKRRMINA